MNGALGLLLCFTCAATIVGAVTFIGLYLDEALAPRPQRDPCMRRHTEDDFSVFRRNGTGEFGQRWSA